MRKITIRASLLLILFGMIVVSCSGGGGSSLKIVTTSPLPDGITQINYPTPSTSPFVFRTENSTAPVTWTFENFVPNKPVGLNFNSTGSIDGAPAKYMDGDYTFDVTAKDSAGKKRTVNFALKIWSKVTIDSPTDLPVAMPGPASFNYTILASGGSGTFNFSAGTTKPSWISLNSSTGEISGTPPSNATGKKFDFEITAACTTKTTNYDTKTFSISITPAEIHNVNGPSEIYASQTVDLTFDITNHGSSPFSVTTSTITFTTTGGVSGDANSDYQVLASVSNPTQISGNTTESFLFKVSASAFPTKAISTAPISIDIEVDFSMGGTPVKTYSTNSLHWAVRVWETMAAMPGKRFWGAAAELDNHIYYFGGVDDKGDVKYSIFDYDIASNNWSTLSVSLPSKSIFHEVVAANNRIYLIGGSNLTISYKNIYEFNPAGPTLTKIGEMVRERSMCAAASNGSEIFIFGAFQTGSIEMFDLTTHNSVSMNAYANSYGRYLHHAVYYKNKYYSFGGSYLNQYDGHNTVYEYDPVADTLTLKNSLNHEMTGHGLAQIGNYVYCIGGIVSTTIGSANYFQRYDLDTFTVVDCGNYVDRIYGNSAAATSTKIFNMGGISTDTASATKVMRMIDFE